MKNEVDALLQALDRSGCAGAEEELQPVIRSLHATFDELHARRALDGVRSHRCFALLETLATEVAKVADEDFAVYVRRQLAQAKIELGLLDDATKVLQDLARVIEARDGSPHRSEVLGLLGRVFKQRFVLAAAAGDRGEEELRSSIGYYSRVFDQDPAWHGANLVALVHRAERSGIRVDTDDSQIWARRLLGALQNKAAPSWSPWDYASAGEASLALGDRDKVAYYFAHYWNMSNADPFALGGTERQLREIWEITSDSDDPFLSSLILHLEARRLTASGGGASYRPDELVRLAQKLQTEAPRAEATFGAGSAIPLEKVLALLGQAKSVCRISDPLNPELGGTGFLVKGRDLCPGLDDELFVLTNHHVLHGNEADDALLESPDYQGSVDVTRGRAEFHYWDGRAEVHRVQLAEVCRHSLRSDADFAVASLAEPVPRELALSMSSRPKPLGSRNVVDAKQRAKVFVVGHPKGRDLSFSLSDNEVVDHELDDAPSQADRPRCIHYRAPTEPGSSGSPVFDHRSLEVVGVHRSGHAKPLRSDWPRDRSDQPYEANEAISIRTVLERLA